MGRTQAKLSINNAKRRFIDDIEQTPRKRRLSTIDQRSEEQNRGLLQSPYHATPSQHPPRPISHLPKSPFDVPDEAPLIEEAGDEFQVLEEDQQTLALEPSENTPPLIRRRSRRLALAEITEPLTTDVQLQLANEAATTITEDNQEDSPPPSWFSPVRSTQKQRPIKPQEFQTPPPKPSGIHMTSMPSFDTWISPASHKRTLSAEHQHDGNVMMNGGRKESSTFVDMTDIAACINYDPSMAVPTSPVEAILVDGFKQKSSPQMKKGAGKAPHH